MSSQRTILGPRRSDGGVLAVSPQIIIAGLLTFVYATAWFDIAVGLIIAVLNLSAAKEVWEEAD